LQYFERIGRPCKQKDFLKFEVPGTDAA
jgi:hypothetical protein